MTKKKSDPIYEGPLAEPIVDKLDSSLLLPDEKVVFNPYALVERFKKMELLAEHYGVKIEGPAGWGFDLAMALAQEHVPGFRIVYNDPLAAQLGLPVKAGAKAGAMGKGFEPALSEHRLVAVADAFITKGLFGNDSQFVEAFAKAYTSRKSEQKGLASTLRRRLVEARKKKRTGSK